MFLSEIVALSASNLFCGKWPKHQMFDPYLSTDVGLSECCSEWGIPFEMSGLSCSHELTIYSVTFRICIETVSLSES